MHLDEKLDERAFFRASRKHIVNLSWVEGIESWFNGGLMVRLRGATKWRSAEGRQRNLRT